MKKPVLLAILDGMGLRSDDHGNAVHFAKTPNLDKYFDTYPHTTLRADGEFVGLPEGQMGNSEVGHTNIGAGRIVYQSLAKINVAIKDKSFFDNKILLDSINSAKDHSLHVMGLVSDGGVHSHINHLFATLEMAKNNGVKNLFVHVFLDGRDVDPKSGVLFVKQVQDKLDELGVGVIASISGRYYAMDRDKRWDRVKLAYDAVVCHTSKEEFTNPVAYVEESYNTQVFDEFVKPAINSSIDAKIKDNDSVIFINFRPDRAQQLSGVLTNKDYDPKPTDPVFVPKYRPNNLNFVQMMKFSDEVKGSIAFNHEKLDDTFGDVVSKAGMNQLRIAETEKYPHVTFFFDGGVEKEIPGAKRILIDSPKVATYDLQPEMSAYEVKDALINEISLGDTDVVILNFANPDMVGHTGMLIPTAKAIEAVDECLGEIVNKVLEMDGVCCITADHGNSELVTNDDESPNTAHTTNPVPFIVTSKDVTLNDDGKLADIAPTLLKLLKVEQPKLMTGKSIVK